MKALLLVNQFPPFATSAARLYAELAEDLVAKGHEVTVVTNAPPAGTPGEIRDPPGVRVARVNGLPLPRNVPALRALDHLWAPMSYVGPALRAGRHDVVLVYSPPLPLARAGRLLARRWKARLVVNVQDLYPKTAIDLGLLKSRIGIRAAERMERAVYRTADAIVVHSPGNRDYVVAKGAPAERAHVIPNWVDLAAAPTAEPGRPALREMGLAGKFVVFYGGAMGWAQAVDDVLGAADALRDREDVAFLLVGDGVMREPMERLAAERGLANVVFRRTVPPATYNRILAECDLALMTLRHELASPVVPGKLQSIMAAGKPVLASANPVSDSKSIVETAGCGVFVPAGRPAEVAAAVRRLAQDGAALREMGARGRAYAEKEFNRRDCVGAFEGALLGPARSKPFSGEPVL